MTRRARRMCTTPTCPTVTDGGPCPACRAKRDRARGTASERGYTAAWADFSRRWLRLHRWCGERADFRRHADDSACTRAGLWTRATETDHVTALRAGGEQWDHANLQSLCGACHRRKTIATDGALVTV